MKYLSVCAGIEAASVAWHPLGWEAVGYSEIEPFPSAVLKHHYPEVTNFGDMTKYKEWNLESIDLLVGGTPCQSFSVAGLRKGLADPRGNLALVYCGILDHFRPQWFVWENVPGVLSSGGGRDFGSFLGALAELGYGFAYRVLDAQYFGVAQRRRRVFVVGYLGDWRPAAEVLFERESMRGDSAPSREKRQEVARVVAPSLTASNDPSRSPQSSEVAQPMAFAQNTRDEVRWVNGDGQIVGALAAEAGMKQTSYVAQPIAFEPGKLKRLGYGDAEPGLCPTLRADAGDNQLAVAQPIAFRETADCLTAAYGRNWNGNASATNGSLFAAQPIGLDEEQNAMVDAFGTLKARTAGGGFEGTVMQPNMAVRRLTPVECERLQGFPDNYTNIPWRKAVESPDGPRYKALGNSMAVPVMAWIGQRIANYEQQA